MSGSTIRPCGCPECRQPGGVTRDFHALINLFLSTLTHEQRCLFTGLEVYRLGPGTAEQVALVTGLTVADVTLGQRQLLDGLALGYVPRDPEGMRLKKMSAFQGDPAARSRKLRPGPPGPGGSAA